MYLIRLALIFSTAISAMGYSGENKEIDDLIFKEVKGSVAKQVILGLTEQH